MHSISIKLKFNISFFPKVIYKFSNRIWSFSFNFIIFFIHNISSLTEQSGNGNGGGHTQHQGNGQGVFAEPFQLGLFHQQAAGHHDKGGNQHHAHGDHAGGGGNGDLHLHLLAIFHHGLGNEAAVCIPQPVYIAEYKAQEGGDHADEHGILKNVSPLFVLGFQAGHTAQQLLADQIAEISRNLKRIRNDGQKGDGKEQDEYKIVQDEFIQPVLFYL